MGGRCDPEPPPTTAMPFAHPTRRRRAVPLVALIPLALAGLLSLPARAAAPEAPPLDFDAWRRDFAARALDAGISAPVLTAELDGLSADPRVVRLDGHQPEHVRTIGEYLRGVVSDARVKGGLDAEARVSQLPTIESASGVPREILVAIWALESAYGQIQGDFDVVRALATLAADGRRRSFAESELLSALQLIDGGRASRAQLVGSWAGGIGQTQLLPSKWQTLGSDGDGDGRVDLRASSADALASAARLLREAGWMQGGRWAVEVLLPDGFDYTLTESASLTPGEWQARGVARVDAADWSVVDAGSKAVLLLPAGHRGPAFLCLPNHFVLRAYNNAVPYALGVGLLADRLAGQSAVVSPWPEEIALTLDERIALQTRLNELGFDAGDVDGLIGAGTRAALRRWQATVGLPADGYADETVLSRLLAEPADSAGTDQPPADSQQHQR